MTNKKSNEYFELDKSIKNKHNTKNITIKELKKIEVIKLLDEMFEIINSNMKSIIDTGSTEEENYKSWKKSMLQELENKTKKWVAAFENKKLIGYFLYKIDNDIVNLDEIQVIKEHQRDKCTFIKLFKYILNEKIENNTSVTTYVNNNNDKSNGIVKKFGFKVLEKKERGTKYITSYKNLKEKLEQYVIE